MRVMKGEYKHALVLEESDVMASWDGPEQVVGIYVLLVSGQLLV
jgi:hypothetical protein